MTSGVNTQRTDSGFERRLWAPTGAVFNFQFWYRDPTVGGSTFSLSDALSLTFCL